MHFPTVSKKAQIVCEKAPIASKKAKIVNHKQKSSTVSRKLSTVNKKAASKELGQPQWHSLLEFWNSDSGNAGRVEKSMGHNVPWKTWMLIYHPETSRPLIILQQGREKQSSSLKLGSLNRGFGRILMVSPRKTVNHAIHWILFSPDPGNSLNLILGIGPDLVSSEKDTTLFHRPLNGPF